jgi:hypothetical protein
MSSKLTNRSYGLTCLGMAGFLDYIGIDEGIKLPMMASTMFIAEGIGDIITGEHHHIFRNYVFRPRSFEE